MSRLPLRARRVVSDRLPWLDHRVADAGVVGCEVVPVLASGRRAFFVARDDCPGPNEPIEHGTRHDAASPRRFLSLACDASAVDSVGEAGIASSFASARIRRRHPAWVA